MTVSRLNRAQDALTERIARRMELILANAIDEQAHGQRRTRAERTRDFLAMRNDPDAWDALIDQEQMAGSLSPSPLDPQIPRTVADFLRARVKEMKQLEESNGI